MRIAARRVYVVIHDLIMVSVAWSIAFWARYNFDIDASRWSVAFQLLPLIIVLQAGLLWWTGLYRGVWRFASVPDLWNIIRASLLGVLLITLALFFYNRLDEMPRTSLVLYPVFLVILLGGPRLAYRMWKEHRFGFRKRDHTQDKRVLIVGAGRAGEMLARDILRHGEHELVGFLDDQLKLKGSKLHGLPVLGTIDDMPKIVGNKDIEVAVIALPSASNLQMQRVVDICEKAGVQFRTLPPLHDMVTGQYGISEVREVYIEDLLGRDPIKLDWEKINHGLVGKVILITGGGGSIGSELCNQIARLAPASLVILERCEFNLYKIDLQLRKEFPNLSLQSCLGDVTDPAVVEQVFSRYLPDVVFHAAAYKHVPLLQGQPREAVHNNVIGTKNLAQAADRHRVGAFIMISTDKAVNPANVMGATKRIAEIYCQNLNHRSRTKFVTVRFGNVLGSAGSVVPLFRKQIEQGGPVTVTHKDISRYFMTIPEACQLIMQAGSMGKGGEIFVLDMGEPIQIRYLAEQMIRLSGKKVDEDIAITYTGLRPGEKLYEELFHEKEDITSTGHSKIMLSGHRRVDWTILESTIEQIAKACKEYDEHALKNLIDRLVPELTDDESVSVITKSKNYNVVELDLASN